LPVGGRGETYDPKTFDEPSLSISSGVGTYTMYDSVSPGNIPRNAVAVAGYVDGFYAWSQAAWDMFPNSLHIPIAVHPGTNAGIVLDVEPGDATPAQAAGWIRMRNQAGLAVANLYCNNSELGQVMADNVGLSFNIWLAEYTQVPHIPNTAAACQYADPGPYDISLCNDWWPQGFDPFQFIPTGGDMVIAPSGSLYEIYVYNGAIFLFATQATGQGMDDVVHGRNVSLQALGHPTTGVTAVPLSERIGWDSIRNQLALKVLGSDRQTYVGYKGETGDLVGWYVAQWSSAGGAAPILADLGVPGPPGDKGPNTDEALRSYLRGAPA
jgi:hypothetical protein